MGYVASALALELPAYGWDVTLVSGSRTDLAAFGDAARFYAGVELGTGLITDFDTPRNGNLGDVHADSALEEPRRATK